MSLLSHVVNSSNEDYLSANNNTVYSKNIIGIEATNSSSHSTTVTNVTEEASFDYISYNNEERPKLTTTSTNLTVFNSACASTDITKRYQTKMLLASLIEHFCKAYGDKPDANRKVFFLICQTLRSLGIIDAEFVDEMTSVRSSFQQAFHKLFFTAVQTVRNQDLLQFDDNLPRLIKQQENTTDYFTNDNNDSSSESSYSSSTTTSSSSSISKSNAIKVRKQKKKDKEKDYFSSCASSSNDIGGISFASLNLTPPTSSKLSTSNSTLHSFVHAGDIFQNLSVQNSRYNNDFVELNLLGKGGFASAFRARNKLDGIDYAVKKIRLGNDIEESDRLKENPYEKIFREIKNLARLEHINVIRYYASWLEFDESNSREDSDESDWEVDSTRIKSNNNLDESRSGTSIFNGYDPTFDDSDFNNNYNMPSESGMSQIQFGDDSGGYEAGKNDSSSVSTRPSSISNKTSTESIPRQTGWTLFIQMQLCATTLHDYIRSRNKKCAEDESYMNDQVDTDRNIEIFSQILQGTAYIHDQGLIHRDLKPSNIFLSMSNNQQEGRRKRTISSSTTGGLESSGYYSSSTNTSYRSSNDVTVSEDGLKDCMWEESWVPKIGDFGLAAEALEEGENGDAILVPTPISSTPPSPKFPTTEHTSTTDDNIDNIQLDFASNANSSSNSSRPKRPKPRRTRTIGVGTRTYASPEQLAIPAQAYDEKVDIYSLGIILFELFQPFTTGMERADYLEKLKHGVFPEGFLEMYPKVSALIIWMMDERPDQRPSARQLLEFELFSQPEDLDICATLQTQLQKKTTIIEELKKKVERVELEKRLAINEMQQKLNDMQRQLDNLQQGGHHHHHHNSDSKHGFLKKCSILTHSPSVLKKKKEVRWSEA